MNREHCLFGADRCVAVSPSDTAPALIALDAKMIIKNADGERSVPAENFFMEPSVDIERMTVLAPGDILVAINIPNTWSDETFYFEKVADRNTWDFALLNIAAAMRVENDRIVDIRIACGGVECVPRRLTVVEDIVKGAKKDSASATLAGGAASRGAIPLNHNHFKIPLMENLVARAIRDA
jgi:xanthine dehydrogenase YagS FAD-binding subunit